MSAPQNSENIHKARFSKIVFGGKTLGHFENGFALFAPKILPDEEAEVCILRKKRNYAEARVLQRLSDSPERVIPTCPFFEECGGCTFQNLPYEKSLFWKSEFLRESLSKLGHFSSPVLEKILKPIIPASEIFRYRNKTEFSFARSPQGDLQIGFHKLGCKFDLLAQDSCLLQSETADLAFCSLQKICSQSQLTPFAPTAAGWRAPWQGFLKSITLRTNHLDQILISLLTSDKDFPAPELDLWLGQLQAALGEHLLGFIQIREHQKKGSKTQTTFQTLWGQDTFRDQVDSLHFEIGARSFFQVNRAMSAQLLTLLRSHLESIKSQHLLDLFCGSGFLGMGVAQTAQKVTGIEIEPSAVREGKRNLELNKIQNYTFHEGDAAQVLERLLAQGERFDTAIVDPPRAGLGAHACDILLQADAAHLIYISCNPATLARDLQYLTERGYKLLSAQPLDMFPQTYHLETCAFLEKGS